jgi:hypothetical protein
MRSSEDASSGRQAWFHTTPGETPLEKYIIDFKIPPAFDEKFG